MAMPETRCFTIKCILLRWCGANIGKRVRINSSAVFCGIGSLTIGDDVWIGPRCYICADANSSIAIGCCCDLAPEVMIFTGSHIIDPRSNHIAGAGYCGSVVIGNGSWLGARSMILPGVHLAKKTVVAAGSVVLRSCHNQGSLLAGSPAIVKKLYGNV